MPYILIPTDDLNRGDAFEIVTLPKSVLTVNVQSDTSPSPSSFSTAIEICFQYSQTTAPPYINNPPFFQLAATETLSFKLYVVRTTVVVVVVLVITSVLFT